MLTRTQTGTVYVPYVDLPLSTLAVEAGLLPEQVCTLLDISPRTWQRYCQGGAPVSVHLLLKVLAGHLPWVAFTGWQCRRGRLYSPRLREGFTPAQIENIPYLTASQAELQHLLSQPVQFRLEF